MSESKRLYRSQKEKMIAGVCGGIAEYFNIDPVIVRIIAILLLLPGGAPGLIPYLVLWVVIPVAPDVSVKSDTSGQSDQSSKPIDVDPKPKA